MLVDVALPVTTLIAASTLVAASRWVLFSWPVIAGAIAVLMGLSSVQLWRAFRRTADPSATWGTPLERFRSQLTTALARARRFEEHLVVAHLAPEADPSAPADAGRVERFRTKLRSYDIAEELDDGTVLVFLPNVAATGEALGIVERLRRELAEIGGVTISAGWSSFPHDGEDIEALMTRARIASEIAAADELGSSRRTAWDDTVLADAQQRDDVLELVARASELRGASSLDLSARDSVLEQIVPAAWTEAEVLLARAATRIWDGRLATGELDHAYAVRQLHVRQAEQLLVSHHAITRPPLTPEEQHRDRERADDLAALLAATDVLAHRGEDLSRAAELARQLRPAPPSLQVLDDAA